MPMVNVYLKSTLLVAFTTLFVSAAHAVCITKPSEIATTPDIKTRMDTMGGYEDLVGVYKGKLKKGILTFPIKIHIIHQNHRFFLRMEWKEVFSTKKAEHSFRVCATPALGANGLYIVLPSTPLNDGAPYGLGGLRHYKVWGYTTTSMTLDLAPDELGPTYVERNLVIKNIKKIQ